MSGDVIHYRDHRRALDRWYPMERYHYLKREGLVPTLLDLQEKGPVKVFNSAEEMLADLSVGADTAPSEYSAPEQDPA